MKRLGFIVLLALAACQVHTGTPPQQPQQQGVAPQPWVQPQTQPQPQPQQRPLLAPLVGTPAMQAEVRIVLAELIRNLPHQYSKKITGIPLLFESTPEVNAYAGCEENGSAFMAGTQGLLDAVDAMSQTTATDELFGTRTYEAWLIAVMPKLLAKDAISPALPPGIIPVQYLADPRRLSREHEIFDDVAAFTFGHELSHHYLGHTGCAVGDDRPPATLEELAKIIARGASRVPLFNQPNEVAADQWGVINVLETGKARPPFQYRFTERGAYLLLDFFSRIEASAGMNDPFVAFIVSHPNSRYRLSSVQQIAQTWWSQQPR
jgi:hypothetical protein